MECILKSEPLKYFEFDDKFDKKVQFGFGFFFVNTILFSYDKIIIVQISCFLTKQMNSQLLS